MAQSKNLRIFDKITHDFNMTIEECMQKVATEARDYFVEQFDAQDWPDKPWKPKVDGDLPTLVDTGNLITQLRNVDQNWTRNGKGIKLHLEVLSDKGFDYGYEQNVNQERTFFDVSDQLTQRIRRVYEENINRNVIQPNRG